MRRCDTNGQNQGKEAGILRNEAGTEKGQFLARSIVWQTMRGNGDNQECERCGVERCHKRAHRIPVFLNLRSRSGPVTVSEEFSQWSTYCTLLVKFQCRSRCHDEMKQDRLIIIEMSLSISVKIFIHYIERKFLNRGQGFSELLARKTEVDPEMLQAGNSQQRARFMCN